MVHAMYSRSLLILFAVSLISKLALAFDASASSNVAVYWGQNSGGGQERLRDYCDSSSVDIVLVSFMTAFPSVALNFANQCGDTFSSGLLHCPAIGSDITYCQSMGKKVLLSLGGASGAYGFQSDSEAETFAGTLWNMFGAGSGTEERPFDNAIVDGFDLDIENNNPIGYAALVTKLRQYFATDSSKQYYISAAPQCPYPDASVGDAMAKSDIDFAFIQFYNNYCNLGPNFNWKTWLNYATSVSPNPNIKLYLGLPAASNSAGTGYASASTVEQYLDLIKDSPQFGGISLWDASSGWANTDSLGTTFVEQMKNLLIDSSSPALTSSKISRTSSTSTTSSTSSTSTTSSTSATSTPLLALSTSSTSSTSSTLSTLTTNTFSSSKSSTAPIIISPSSSASTSATSFAAASSTFSPSSSASATSTAASSSSVSTLLPWFTAKSSTTSDIVDALSLSEVATSSSPSLAVSSPVSSTEAQLESETTVEVSSALTSAEVSSAVPSFTSAALATTDLELEVTLSSKTTPVSDLGVVDSTSSTRPRRVVTWAFTETVTATSWVTIPSTTQYSTTTIHSVPGFFQWFF
ncbi:Chitinase 1 [Scheffersomyces spartinae]|uniref:chitinase n=1 Tax=Scheffersomyces spartinae TaxID=45513 RepID=A0A9P7V6N5_9ASCO|nr:Chitinase 1 [Scheffersomyces spartinae]KAG7191899.1 Chitinase 1 [Scheffersomyces spartinae]